MRIAIWTAVVIYAIGFVLMMWMHTQMPATFALALVRSACWPVSVVKREIWPRGTPLLMD